MTLQDLQETFLSETEFPLMSSQEGFPCQDISVAGRREGITENTRSGLWYEIVRLTRELSPRYVIVENVANLLSGPSERRGGWFGRVLGDLAELGYDAEWENIPASALGAPHRRERVWIIAYPKGQRCGKAREFQSLRLDEWFTRRRETAELTDNRGQRVQGSQPQQVSGFKAFSWCEDVGRVEDLRGRRDIPEPTFRGGRDGVPHWMDRIKACGNAVIPQIPELIGNAILEAEHVS